MDLRELEAVVSDLRTEGSDLAEIEVKRATGGFPETVAATLSAFANTPGGGTLILGLEEAAGAFVSRGVYDPAACQASLASVARQALDPPVAFQSSTVAFEGHELVVVTVGELSSLYKPCRVKRTGKAYLRAYDGDYEVSPVEEQAFIANRGASTADREPVAGAARADLDPELVQSYVDSCRSTSAALARLDVEDVLFRTGVLVGDERVPSVAGLLALGSYPQQHLPSCVIQASVAPTEDDPAGTRASDVARFDGPVPVMLDEALRWVQRNSRTRIRFGRDGHGRDESEYPPTVVRELLSNALVHRDLGPHAMGERTTLKLDRTQMVISNPGGLHGLTVERLGRTGVTSARNSYLVGICQNVRYGGGQRVVEALASGIPTVLRELGSAGMVPPRFHDQAVRFTVRVPNHTLLSPDDLAWVALLGEGAAVTDVQRHALVNMRHGARYTNKTFREAFPMDSREARVLLGSLVDQGLAEAIGERGGRVYTLRRGSLLPGISGGTNTAVTSPPDPGTDTATGGVRRARKDGPRAENAQRIHRVLQDGPAGVRRIAEQTELTPRQVRHALTQLIDAHRVAVEGGQGRRDTVYRVVET